MNLLRKCMLLVLLLPLFSFAHVGALVAVGNNQEGNYGQPYSQGNAQGASNVYISPFNQAPYEGNGPEDWDAPQEESLFQQNEH